MAGIRSRYHGLAPVETAGRTGPALRRLDPLASGGAALEHRLVVGETLDALAKRYYGDESLWWRIADANPARLPDDWAPGDLLRVPALRRSP